MQTIGYNEIVGMIRGAAGLIAANHQELSKLDSATGDGDHGTAINLIFQAANEATKADVGGKIQELLNKVGWDVMCVDGGSSTPLMGSFFTGMGEAAGPESALNAAAVAALFEAGLASLRKQTKAAPGDKTMVDALVPAVEAIRAAANAGSDVPAALKAGAEAAKRGAESTKEMVAKFGRARNLGERTRGLQDPGATSVSYIFRGFAEGVLAK